MKLAPSDDLDDNAKFIIAAAINLYKESLRRISNRALFVADDIEPLLGICEELVKNKSVVLKGTLPEGRDGAPTEEEAEQLLTATDRRI